MNETVYESKLNFYTLAELQKQPSKEFDMLSERLLQALVSGKEESLSIIAEAIFKHEINILNKPKGLYYNIYDKRWCAVRWFNGKKYTISRNKDKDLVLNKLIEFCRDHGLTW
jgi:hypothetical protein